MRRAVPRSSRPTSCSAASGTSRCCPEAAAERRAWPSPLRDGLPALLDELAGTTRRRARVRRPARLRHRDDAGRPARRRRGRGPAGACRRSRSRGPGWAGRPSRSRSCRDHRDADLATWRPGDGSSCCRPTDRPRRRSPRLLTEAGYGASAMTVLADLGSDDESRVDGVAASWGDGAAPTLNVVAVTCVGGPALGWTAGLPGRRVRPRRPDHQARPARVGARPPGPRSAASCSGTSARAPDRSRSSGCGRIRPAGRSRSRRARTGAKRIAENAAQARRARPRRRRRPRARGAGRVSTRRTRSSSAAARPSPACSTPAGTRCARRPARRPRRDAGDRARCSPSATPRSAAS